MSASTDLTLQILEQTGLNFSVYIRLPYDEQLEYELAISIACVWMCICMCFMCLWAGHISKNCPSKFNFKCFTCEGPHNFAIYYKGSSWKNNVIPKPQVTPKQFLNSNRSTTNTVFLPRLMWAIKLSLERNLNLKPELWLTLVVNDRICDI